MTNKLISNQIIALFFGVIMISCQKQEVGTENSEEKTVNVSLNIGFSEEADGYEFTQTTRGELDEKAAFDFELVPTPETRANTNVPDALYNLEICQYTQSGSFLKRTRFTETKSIGEKLDITLTPATGCQLVIVAWGSNVSGSKTLGTGNLSSAMEATYSADLIKNITTDAAEMKGMPYVLHLKNVNVIQDGSTTNGFIQSGTGEVDARLRLKRLAALLTFSWDYKVNDYGLKQVLLQSVPMNFRVIPNPDQDGSYPSLIDQFTTIQLTDEQITKGSYSCWVPANVRGDRAEANTITNRYKATAPQGSMFVNFIAVNNIDAKKKLDYRVYLGGTSVTNFDVRSNTNYTYQVNFSHTGIPLNDKRVTYIDPIPASANNNNFVPTSNCFMVAPGGSFNFDPTVMQVNGSNKDNPYLKGVGKWGDIASVKLLWQTKENGDVGDPVIGVVNTVSDHSNIVEYKGGRIYCRVAPNTSGGSGLIAAYDGSGNILWSWHVWVTDYNPDARGNVSVDTPNKRKQKYTYNSASQLPIMDRNLGAQAGYTTVPPTELEKSRTNGFHYQWGRKDPFPSSYTEKQLSSITISSTIPTIGMLNLYKPDGVSFFQRTVVEALASLKTIYQNPSSVYIAAAGSIVPAASGVKIWCNEIMSLANPSYSEFWGMTGNKGFHDPCPAGWRVASKNEYKALYESLPTDDQNNDKQPWPLNAVNNSSAVNDGGVVVYFENLGSGRTTYIRLNGYQEKATKFNFVGKMVDLWCRETNADWGTKSGVAAYAFCANYPGGLLGVECSHIKGIWDQGDAHPVRCIQERQ